MSVYFHANFNLNRDRLAGILYNLIEHPELNDEQIAKQFGYKAPYAKRYKSWLRKCGIIENTIKVKLTEYGRIIYNRDPKLKKNQLYIISIHFYLAVKTTRWYGTIFTIFTCQKKKVLPKPNYQVHFL